MTLKNEGKKLANAGLGRIQTFPDGENPDGTPSYSAINLDRAAPSQGTTRREARLNAMKAARLHRKVAGK